MLRLSVGGVENLCIEFATWETPMGYITALSTNSRLEVIDQDVCHLRYHTRVSICIDFLQLDELSTREHRHLWFEAVDELVLT